MNRKHAGYRPLLGIILSAVFSAQTLAVPVIFEGTDAGAGPASPRPNSDAAAASFGAATVGLGTNILVNFESAPVGNFASLPIAPGVTATLQGTDSGGGIRNTLGTSVEGYNTTSGGAKYLGVWPIFDIGTARLIFDFNQPIVGFGSYITGLGTANGNLFVLFNDGSSQSIPVVGSSQGGAKFFGFIGANPNISQVVFELRNVSGTRDIFAVDDLRYVQVPEPGTLIAGAWFSVVGLGWIRRRRGG
jgi:hypothetical protein